jgi:hypothetical protein
VCAPLLRGGACGAGCSTRVKSSAGTRPRSLDPFPGERTLPRRQLRVLEAAGSRAAAEQGFRVHQNMRVLESSVVAHAFRDGFIAADSGRERLEIWETSSGGPIGQGWIDVEVRCFDEEVWARLRFQAPQPRRSTAAALRPGRDPSAAVMRRVT